MSQNIYDNESFFDKYMKLRSNKYCANDLEEKPELYAMLPNLDGKKVLDLGCGYGDDCRYYRESGAERVVGIDISQRMIAEAEKRNRDKGITFINLDVADLNRIEEKFDIIVSSLAMHYVRDYSRLCENVNSLLCSRGIFLFSQEHPIFTATKRGVTWQSDIDNLITGMVVEDYTDSGERSVYWLVDNVVKYHRTFSDIINPLIESGFTICMTKEPGVSEDKIELSQALSRCRHVPDYLFVLAQKNS